jgi:hypothetical protein
MRIGGRTKGTFMFVATTTRASAGQSIQRCRIM